MPAEEINTYFESLDSINIRKLNNFESNLCEGDITAIECDKVLSKFKENKSPGSDGLPIEFYKQFWHLLKDHMTSVFNEALDNEKLSDSQSQGILTLLHKKGDPQLLKNYRPISLLNTDYNILMHIYYLIECIEFYTQLFQKIKMVTSRNVLLDIILD